MVTAQLPVPVHPSDQPLKVDPDAGAAASVTTMPAGYCTVQSLAQVMPASELVTVPAPLPPLVTVRVKLFGGIVLNVAPTVLAASIVTLHAPMPEQAPDQP